MSREEQKIIDYMVVCVNEFADRFSFNYKQTFNYLNPCELQDYLITNNVKPIFTTSDIKSDGV